MKRYWISIVLVALIIISMGTFYIQTLTNPLPNFQLMKLEGDEKEASHVILLGSYNYSTGQVVIDENGSTYDSERPYLTKLSPHIIGREQIDKLVSDHRNFMRGKENIAGFYEDKQVLVYSDIRSTYHEILQNYSFGLKVWILDKENNQTKSFELDVPKSSDYLWVNVQDVQLVDNQLKIITQNNKRNKNDSNNRLSLELHICSIDLAEEKLVDDRIAGTDNKLGGSQELQFALVNDTNLIKPNERMVFQLRTNKIKVTSENSYESTTVDNSFVSYDLRTGKEEVIPFPLTEPSNKNNVDYFNTGERLIQTASSSEGIHIQKYNLEGRRSEPEIVLSLKDLQADSISSMNVDTRNLYVLVKKQNAKRMIIVDLGSGKVVYKGSVALKGTTGAEKEHLSKLNVYNLQVLNR
ncbi:hypothetical protein Back11_25520 [Paenibacillus baekrokdamisoli]|uniref:Uncharacterized protein n=1 Tax=Paenibacillus baekrokdamisoli TaxID=1712516 RepID=A0A3G9IQQ1_9BACL|nr:hypothetical protein [Paenibacillus baekrokdamisoli]MBB3070201.1 hypothetical protein [Paenibacillus baekrokdamisoli]BBH21207.1 hypothetical protein Back11_25520 [Paenibacillus baekrokdamisoli]